MMMAAFTLNGVASSAMVVCSCADMIQTGTAGAEMASMEKPCHDMNMAQAGQSSTADETNAAQCMDCGCGHCKIPSHTSVLGKLSSSDMPLSSTLLRMPCSAAMMSDVIFGIDNPPKHIS